MSFTTEDRKLATRPSTRPPPSPGAFLAFESEHPHANRHSNGVWSSFNNDPNALTSSPAGNHNNAKSVSMSPTNTHASPFQPIGSGSPAYEASAAESPYYASTNTDNAMANGSSHHAPANPHQMDPAVHLQRNPYYSILHQSSQPMTPSPDSHHSKNTYNHYNHQPLPALYPNSYHPTAQISYSHHSSVPQHMEAVILSPRPGSFNRSPSSPHSTMHFSSSRVNPVTPLQIKEESSPYQRHSSISSPRQFTHTFVHNSSAAVRSPTKELSPPVAKKNPFGDSKYTNNRPLFPIHGHISSSAAAPGPIPATTPIQVYRDNSGVQWISFEYSRDRVKVKYAIRCDVDNVNIDALSDEFKLENCVYPRAYCREEDYKGNRFVYEAECNAVGWALADLNEALRGKRGLIQRAVDSWRNSNKDPRFRSRRVRRLTKMMNRQYGSSMTHTPRASLIQGPASSGLATIPTHHPIPGTPSQGTSSF